jgi:hypothetical protein
MNTSLRLLAASCVLFLGACGEASTAGSVEAAIAARCNPAGEFKIDEAGPQELTCPAGEVVTGICIKAGNAVYGAGGMYDGLPEGCYVFDLEGGSVSGGGTGRDCKGISHTEFNCGPGEPPCECEVAEDCISPKSGAGGDLICDGCNCVPRPCECEVAEDCISPKSGTGGDLICDGCNCIWL